MNPYYKEKLKEGKEYEKFIKLIFNFFLEKAITIFENKEDQINIGESKEGFEIKLDNKFKKTNNLYIEYKEKTDSNNINFVDSGILRKDNTKFWIIGDYKNVFVFNKNVLIEFHNTKQFREVKTETSKGYLIPKVFLNNKLKKISNTKNLNIYYYDTNI